MVLVVLSYEVSKDCSLAITSKIVFSESWTESLKVGLMKSKKVVRNTYNCVNALFRDTPLDHTLGIKPDSIAD